MRALLNIARRIAMASSPKHVVCYHYPCVDGVFAALCAHLHFTAAGQPVRYVPLTVYKKHDPSEIGLSGDETVYMLDFVGPPGYAVKLAELCKEVQVLDHHKTAMADLGEVRPSNMKVVFDMERSGASISRDFFQPKLSDGAARMVAFVEDGDLWRWKVAGSKAFYAYLKTLDLEFDAVKNPGIFDQLLGIDVKHAIAEGERALEEQERRVDACLATSFVVQLGGESGKSRGWGQCLALMGDGPEELRSDIGNKLASKSAAQGLRPSSVFAYHVAELGPDSIKLSFRSLGDEDTTPVSLAYGGGGHARASSCNVPKTEFESWRV